MFKLPECPYCGKKLGYKASASLMSGKTMKCRKCGKLSQVKYRARCVKLAVVFAALLITLNTLMLFSENNKTLLPNIILTVGVIIIYLALTPLNVRLFEIEGQRDPEPKRKKNRRRHKKTKYNEVEFDENPLKGTTFD